MRRYLWVFALLILVACSSPVTGSSGGQCAWVYDSRGRPDTAAKVQNGLRNAGFPTATATVTDLGESCGDRFARQYSEFRVTLLVPDLSDPAQLGTALESALDILGPELGTGSNQAVVTFDAGSKQQTIRFRADQAVAARGKGLRGAALLDALSQSPTR
jgi:hypothetical protein